MATVPAICFRGAGGVEVIALGTTELRAPGPGEVRVEVAAAGVNRADVLQRRGLYPAPPGAPTDVPGLEFSGRVVERGPGATLWPVGAAVMAITGGGAMAREVIVHERELVPVPATVDLITAAAIPEAFFTAWDAMILQGRLAAGEIALIHAVASGVGTAAVQLARAVGARPLGTSRTASKLGRVVGCGLAAADGIVVEGGRFAAAVHAACGGANVILDCVGAAYLEENVRALAPRGRLVMIGTLGGATGPAPVGMILGKRATLIGTVLRARPLEEKIALARAAAAQLVPLFEVGRLTPVVDAVLPMAACAEAHARLERDDTVGKLILRWD